MALLMLLLVTILAGIQLAFGFFFKAIAAEFALSRTVTSLVVSTHIIIGGLGAVVAGRVIDRYGPRRLILAMGLLTGAGLLLTYLVTQPWQFFLTYGLLLALGAGPVYVVPATVLAWWFHKYRATAYGIAFSGAALATLIGAPVASYLISSLDWRLAYVVIGAFAGSALVLIALFFGKASRPLVTPAKTAPEATGWRLRDLVRQPNFRYVLVGWTALGYTMFFIFSHLVPHITDQGYPEIRAVAAISTMGFASLVGRLPAGVLADRIGRRRLGIISAAFLALAMLLMAWASEFWAFYVFAAVFGLAYSSFSTSFGSLVGDVLGTARIGTIFGILELGLGIGAALGALVGGAIYDTSGSYFAAFLIAAGTWIVVSVTTGRIRTEAAGSDATTGGDADKPRPR